MMALPPFKSVGVIYLLILIFPKILCLNGGVRKIIITLYLLKIQN